MFIFLLFNILIFYVIVQDLKILENDEIPHQVRDDIFLSLVALKEFKNFAVKKERIV